MNGTAFGALLLRDLAVLRKNVFTFILRTVMQPRLAALGYVTLRTMRASPLGAPGTQARGHEYHYSRLEALGPLIYAAELQRDSEHGKPDGLVSGNLLAGYAHLHFASNPAIAAALLGTPNPAR